MHAVGCRRPTCRQNEANKGGDGEEARWGRWMQYAHSHNIPRGSKPPRCFPEFSERVLKDNPIFRLTAPTPLLILCLELEEDLNILNSACQDFVFLNPTIDGRERDPGSAECDEMVHKNPNIVSSLNTDISNIHIRLWQDWGTDLDLRNNVWHLKGRFVRGYFYPEPAGTRSSRLFERWYWVVARRSFVSPLISLRGSSPTSGGWKWDDAWAPFRPQRFHSSSNYKACDHKWASKRTSTGLNGFLLICRFVMWNKKR